MKSFKVPALLAMCLLSLAACDPWGIKGEGDTVYETRKPDAFDRINIDISGKTEVYYADEYRVEIQVEESILPYLETEVNDGRLDVFFSHSVRDVDGLRIRIFTPSSLSEIDFNGSGTLIAYDSLVGSQVHIDHEGSGEVYIKKVFAEKLDVHLSGSGKIEVGGLTEDVSIGLSGSGEINTLDLSAYYADVNLSGSGDIRCKVSNTLNVDLSGSGNVWYNGSPSTTINISGSGQVRKL